MLVIPAIDLRGGKCVRLRQGRFDAETVFCSDPVEVAMRWEREGAEFLHIVDLDGAKAGEPRNLDVVAGICDKVKIPMQVGGGIRSTEDVERVLAMGVDRVIVGTRAIREPEWLRELTAKFGGRIALAIDARGENLALEGWQSASDVVAGEFLKNIEGLDIAAIIYTDVNRDGMLAGPNVEAIARFCRKSRIPVIASGGITTVDDVRELAGLPLAGLIIGRALYEGKLTLKQAIAAAETA